MEDMMENIIKGVNGFKVFNPDWTCLGFKYKVGKIFEEKITPDCCYKGFHFCNELRNCFNYYPFDPKNKVAQIIALGEIDKDENGLKSCTNKIYIEKEITWEEVLYIVNAGSKNNGISNSGNNNNGDFNSGKFNSGKYNSGVFNIGNYNNGRHNYGDYNSGSYNYGNHNSGSCNYGFRNSGKHNVGSLNSGDWNITNFSCGCFNTLEQKITMFDKPSDWTYYDWLKSDAKMLLNGILDTPTRLIFVDSMTDKEKIEHPEYKTTNSYLKNVGKKENNQSLWNKLYDREKRVIKSIPNFDAEIFRKITGIDVYAHE